MAFTACGIARRPFLAQSTIHTAFHRYFERACGEFGCLAPIYTIMPDHLHVLIIGSTEASRPLDAMERFKLLSGKWLYRTRAAVNWQEDFYDHIVRESEGWRTQGRYIALNPVRAGLVTEPEQWPYTGSIGYKIQEVLGDAFP